MGRSFVNSVYPTNIDPLLFYQDADLERHPQLAQYYQYLHTNDFTSAKNYLAQSDLDYCGAWLLNTIEDRLRTVETHIDEVLEEKPELVVYSIPEPPDSKWTDECFCWTGESGDVIIENQFWHSNPGLNPIQVVDEDNTSFYFQRCSQGDTEYYANMCPLKPTELIRRDTVNKLGVSVYRTHSIHIQDIRIPLYDISTDALSTKNIRLRARLVDTPYSPGTSSHDVFISASVYDGDTMLEQVEAEADWSAPVGSIERYYWLGGIDTVPGNNTGTATTSNVLYFAFIMNVSEPSSFLWPDGCRNIFFKGTGIDLTNLASVYGVRVDPDYIPSNPLG